MIGQITLTQIKELLIAYPRMPHSFTTIHNSMAINFQYTKSTSSRCALKLPKTDSTLLPSTSKLISLIIFSVDRNYTFANEAVEPCAPIHYKQLVFPAISVFVISTKDDKTATIPQKESKNCLCHNLSVFIIFILPINFKFSPFYNYAVSDTWHITEIKLCFIFTCKYLNSM